MYILADLLRVAHQMCNICDVSVIVILFHVPTVGEQTDGISGSETSANRKIGNVSH